MDSFKWLFHPMTNHVSNLGNFNRSQRGDLPGAYIYHWQYQITSKSQFTRRKVLYALINYVSFSFFSLGEKENWIKAIKRRYDTQWQELLLKTNFKLPFWLRCTKIPSREPLGHLHIMAMAKNLLSIDHRLTLKTENHE